ncbi:mevalonate kinase [Ignicoccus hospitalis]|uniref:Mevalonate kinase n=1 Tax=Ignicoccus hospitalis (strain KIN4/I / DSM 18386 / JCM 14125) TaxID=453591 RepID=A8AAI8_IGNH4|nr:mevalonate kinase [Ignicoccus hospitalis]ABU81940.1 mevalonate kinase [Ignicoccus hospitalis KIN4/I]HIH89901.1 mevalonate kinase [Desulfurococcaceae archaeon]
MSVSARAPTKVTLFGEHSVVYGKPAIVFSMPIYINVKLSLSDDLMVITGPVSLRSVDLVISKDKIEVGDLVRKQMEKYVSYVVEALQTIGVEGARVEIESPMPVGAGVGTSAAVTVGTIAAACALKRCGLNKEGIAKLAWEVEKKVQGKASPMDTFASALGGVLWIEKEDSGWKIERLSVDQLPLVVGIFEKRKTTAELVREVALKVQRSEIYKDIIELMGKIAREAREALIKGDLKELGELMKLNNAMLEALGLVTKEVSNAIHAAELAGAYGAKASGAGSGGAVVALAEDVKAVRAALLASGAKKVFIVENPSRGVELI